MRHHLLDELGCFFVSRLAVDQDFADLVGEVVAQRAHDRIALTVDEEWRWPFQHDIENCVPDGKQILDVPGEFLGTAFDTGRAQDDTHPVRHIDSRQRLSRQIAIVPDDTSRYAPGTVLVRFQDDEPAGEADVGR